MESNNNTPIVVVPNEGKFLTQAADVEILDRIIATTIVLGKNDTRSNWIEINQAQADEYMALKEKEIEERRKAEEEARLTKENNKRLTH